MAIDRYYRSQAGAQFTGPVATPKIIIDMMLMEKYHWTPKEINDIPKDYMDMMMMAINQKLSTEAGVNKIRELENESGIGVKNKTKLIGSGNGGIKQKRKV